MLAVCESWSRYGTAQIFPGGCFIAAVTQEFKSRPGRVRDRLLEGRSVWRTRLENDIQIAVDNGELPASVDPEQTSFMLWAIAIATAAEGAEPRAAAYERAFSAMRAVLGVSTEHSIAA